MNGQLRMTPAGMLPYISAREAILGSVKTQLLARLRDHGVQQVKQSSGLGWQLVE